MSGLLGSNAYNDYIGETVTIFTQSGGCSGQGFTGVLISCNSCFVRLLTSFGSAPDNVFGKCSNGGGCNSKFRAGSVVDIPTDKIVCCARNAL